MANTVQLTKNGQPVFPVTDVSLVMGLQDAIKLPPVKVATLPTASADTAGKMYYVGPDENDEYERYITSAVNGSYEWIDLGNTAIPLPSIADNLTTNDPQTALSAAQGKVLDGKISQLEAKVDDLSTGKYYGYFATSADLPDDATVDGFAYVGEGPTYTIYNLRGGVWTSSNITVNQSPIGNDEDIDQNEDGKLQFADRVYNSSTPDGLGYVILRKNKTFAQQVTATNTIYEIRYEFDLNNASVTIPAGCVLKFNGGKIDNGTIVVSDTIVDTGPVAGFGSGIVVSGVFQNQAVFPEWFGAVGDGQTNDRDAIQKALDVSDNVVGIPGKVYAVATPSPYQHCLTIKRDNQHLIINLKNTDVYDSLNYRGRAVIFCDGKNGFYFRGSITSINDSIPVSASSGITLEWSRGGILCNGNCSDFDIELSCANLYSGIASGAFNDQDYIYRNGTTGVSNGRFIIKANRIAYPVAINYGNNNQIDVTGENMHRCVYICGDYNRIVARGKNYFGAAAPAHVILFANFIEDNGDVVLKTSNYNDVIYKELEGETNFLNEGSMFAYQVVSTSSNPPDYTHIDYGFIGNTFNAYCVNNSNRSSIVSYLFLSPASTWTYDKVVRFDFTLNIYGDATNYVFRGVEFKVAGLLNNIVVNNYTPQKVRFNIADDNADSLYQFFGNQLCYTTKLSGRLVASGNNVECQVGGSSEIVGNVYVHALNPTITITTDYNHKHVHLDNWDYYPASSFRRATPTASQVGVSYFNKSNERPNFWTGSKWIEADGVTAGIKRNGTTAQRPASANISIGFIYFDTDLSKMIVWNGTAWVNMDGSALSYSHN